MRALDSSWHFWSLEIQERASPSLFGTSEMDTAPWRTVGLKILKDLAFVGANNVPCVGLEFVLAEENGGRWGGGASVSLKEM